MGSDTMRMVKSTARALISVVGGGLLGYEYYSFSPSPEDALGVAIAMGAAAAIVIFFLLHNLGKSSD
jgi:peptidoglycan/LPS O-acetylase OafA/YrhL